MKTLLKALTAAAMIALSPLCVHAEEKVVHLGTLGWEDEIPLTLITEKALEADGFKVEITKFAEWGIAHSALAKGDVDLLVAIPDYVTSDYWNRYKDRLEKVSAVSYGVYQSLVVPSYVPIDSIDQLNQVSDKVDGKIVGIEPGSGLMRQVNDAVKSYKLNYKVIDGSTAAMTAALQSALDRKEPIVTMLWKPSWMAMKYDVKFLKDPKHVLAPTDTYFWLAKRGFSQQNPKLREAVASVYIPVENISDINVMVNDGKTFDQAVGDWWNANKSLTDRWLVK